VNAHRGSLSRGDAGALLDQVRIPGRRLSQWDRKHGAIPVDHVPPEQQRDTEATFLERDALCFGAVFGPDGVEERAPAAFADLLPAAIGNRAAQCRALGHLADLLLERHPLQQLVDAILDTGRRGCGERAAK